MFSFINPIKGYLAIAGAAVLAVLIGIFKYRGNKIDELETVVAAKDQEIAVAAKVTDNKIKVVEFESANKVDSENATEDIKENHEEVATKHTIGDRFYL